MTLDDAHNLSYKEFKTNLAASTSDDKQEGKASDCTQNLLGQNTPNDQAELLAKSDVIKPNKKKQGCWKNYHEMTCKRRVETQESLYGRYLR